MPKPITPEMIAAWRTLQDFARHARPNSPVKKAIDVLDISDFMVPIERAEDERRPIPQISTQSAMTGKIYRSDIQPLDPAEWGDTTREDMARHQGQQGEA